MQCSVNSSTVVSSLISTPTLSAGTTTDGGEPSTLQGHLLVLPEPVEESSEVQSVSPPSNGEGSSGTGAVGGGGKSSGNFQAGVLIDVGTQTWPTVDSVQSCNSVCSLQLPGQTDSIWQSEETQVSGSTSWCIKQCSVHCSMSLASMTYNYVCMQPMCNDFPSDCLQIAICHFGMNSECVLVPV